MFSMKMKVVSITTILQARHLIATDMDSKVTLV